MSIESPQPTNTESFREVVTRLVENPELLANFLTTIATNPLLMETFSAAVIQNNTLKNYLKTNIPTSYANLVDASTVLEQYHGPMDDEFPDWNSIFTFYQERGLQRRAAQTLAHGRYTPLKLARMWDRTSLLQLFGIGPETLITIEIMLGGMLDDPTSIRLSPADMDYFE